jgi:hypothetical protein
VLRTMINQQREFNPRAFQVFGPKIVATRGHYEDRGLESRFLTETMGGRQLRGDPVSYSTAEPVRVPIPKGPRKFFHQLVAPLPNAPADKKDIINAYVKAAMTAPV